MHADQCANAHIYIHTVHAYTHAHTHTTRHTYKLATGGDTGRRPDRPVYIHTHITCIHTYVGAARAIGHTAYIHTITKHISHIHAGSHTGRRRTANIYTYIQAGKYIRAHTHRHTYRQADRDTYRQAIIQTYMNTAAIIHRVTYTQSY